MNLDVYNKVREVPKEAQREIKGGRLNGKTEINPMWRIKTLTEQFGLCGIGWYYKIKEKRLEQSSEEIAAFVDIDLFIKVDGDWSFPIPGTGGSMFVAKEKNGLYTSDECFKMALTDALSVACKALGMGADVYWDKDKSKYDREESITSKLTEIKEQLPFETPTKRKVDDALATTIYTAALSKGWNEKVVNSVIKASHNTDNIYELTVEQGKALLARIESK